MRKHLQEYKLLINSISSPLQFGLYKDDKLFKSWEVNSFISDILVEELNSLLKEYKISEIIYTNGPGTFMGIKLTFITLRSLEIIKGVPFFGTLGFELNNNRPIKAMGKLYFIKEKENIITKKFEEMPKAEFVLPNLWSQIKKSKEKEPLYYIPSIG
jgi:tRNA A37 threonylcarbamoyladenosine modification protein TsaB